MAQALSSWIRHFEHLALSMSDGQEDEYDDDAPVVIIDNGSGVCKAGLSTSQQPTVVFPEIIGRPRERWKPSLDMDFYCGDEVAEHRSKLSVSYPLQNGIIENFEEMQWLWDYTFKALGVNAGEHPVLLTEPPYNPRPNRERMVEIMFEYYMVPTLNISIQGVLALLGQGRTTGLVLDSGEGVTHTIPIFDGFGYTPHIKRLDLAGRDLNTLLAKLLAQEGNSLTTTEAQHHVRIMKETFCYCALDPASEFAEAVQYKLPDGREVTLTDERWKCPEALFNPSMAGIESQGVASIVWESISKCDIDVRRTLLNNVVLSGGSTMFPGFSERLAKDLREKAPTAAQANIKVVQTRDQNQKYAVWSGAQVFASLRGMQDDQWMTIEDYDEFGASFIHDKIAVKFS
uniref:Actin n=1 Tax=Noctiluca scintillans TaxID=2966 RepID=A0A7S1AUT6_NOCSC